MYKNIDNNNLRKLHKLTREEVSHMKNILIIFLCIFSLQVTAASPKNDVTQVSIAKTRMSDTWFWNPNNNNFLAGGLPTVYLDFNHKSDPIFQDVTINNYSPIYAINASYSYGRFRAETGYLSDLSDGFDGSKFFIQSSFVVLIHENFNLSLTAKFEALDEELVAHYYNTLSSNSTDSSTNATLGLIGTYDLSPQWKIMGAVTSTTLGDEIVQSSLISDDKYNMALIGTTYYF